MNARVGPANVLVVEVLHVAVQARAGRVGIGVHLAGRDLHIQAGELFPTAAGCLHRRRALPHDADHVALQPDRRLHHLARRDKVEQLVLRQVGRREVGQAEHAPVEHQVVKDAAPCSQFHLVPVDGVGVLAGPPEPRCQVAALDVAGLAVEHG